MADDIEDFLSDVDIKNEIDPETNKTYANLLYEAANDLKDCIQNRLDIYFASYYPRVYQRTGNLDKAMYVDNFTNIKVVGDNQLTIEINFDPNLSFHNSLFHSDDGYTPLLIDRGWKVKKPVWFRDIEYFGYMKPTYFIENGIEDFNHENELGIEVEIQEF